MPIYRSNVCDPLISSTLMLFSNQFCPFSHASKKDQTSGWGHSPAPAPRVPAHGAPCSLPSLA